MIDMKPGRELDVEIAEKVMGWKRMSWCDYHAMKKAQGHYHGTDDREELTYAWHDSDGEMVANVFDTSDYGSEFDNGFYPSTDIADAWQAVEKMSQRDTGMFTIWGEDGFVWAEFGRSRSGIHSGQETAALAICLAALKAIGHSV